MSTLKASNLSTPAGVSTPMADVVNGSARAWVSFNGVGTVAVRSSYNVSSITDLGVGSYQINFTTPMPDANYSVVGTAWFPGSTAAITGVTATNTGSVTVSTTGPSGTSIDASQDHYAIFR